MSETIIGESMTIDGEVSGDEVVVVLGRVKGKVSLDKSLVVPETGVIEADVQASNVEVAGSLTGNISAVERVEVKPGGRMVGDVRSPRILIADGAVFKGNIDMDVGEQA